MINKIPKYPFRKEYEEVGFEIVELDYFIKRHSEEERKSPHRLNFYAIVFITDGKGEHQIDFKTYSYQEKNILFIGKDQIHAWNQHEAINGFIVFFTEDFLYQNQIKFRDLSYSFPYNSFLYEPLVEVSQLNKHRSFHSLLKYIFEEYNLPNHSDKQEILQCLLRTFLLKIRGQTKFENKEVKAENKELFIRLQRMIDEKSAISRNANDYCKWLNVSYRKLNETCKALTNLSIKSLIDKTIILSAKKHLIDKEKNVSDVSYLLGFQEVTNFTKYFKKHAAISPKAFQNSIS